MKTYQYIFLLIFSVLLSSCESMVNDLGPDKLPRIESKLVVESYISPQSEEITVIVTESQPLFGPADYKPTFVKNATVSISGENGEVKIPYVDSTLSYVIHKSQFKIEAGKTYTLHVSDGKRSVKGSCTVPLRAATIKSYEIDSVPEVYSNERFRARVKISWDDIKGERNYYTMRGYTITGETYPGYNPQNPNNSRPIRGTFKRVIETDLDNYLVNDINLDGISFDAPLFYVRLSSKYTFEYIDDNGKKQIANSDPWFSEVYVEILNLDENYYKFYRSQKDARDNDNPFVEPTLVFTNIEGGLGCFGSYNVGSLSIKP